MYAESPLKVLPKITYDHIILTPYLVMSVDLAAQILSSTMTSILNHHVENELSHTSKYFDIIDQFFDCMNVRIVSEHIRKRKNKVAPYTAVDDERLNWLLNVFLSYFDKWNFSIENRGNTFSLNAQSKMFISWQTFEGFKITTNVIAEVTKFLLSEGALFVLTERFCQDEIKEYFGNQRQFGRYPDNPDLQMLEYNDNTIRIQKNVSCTSGNTRRRYGKRKNWVNTDNTPVPKRKVQE